MDKEIQDFYDNIGFIDSVILAGLGIPLLLVMSFLTFIGAVLFVINLVTYLKSIQIFESKQLRQETKTEPTRITKRVLFGLGVGLIYCVIGGVFMCTLPSTGKLITTKEHISEQLLLRAVNEPKEEALVVEDFVTSSLRNNHTYTLDFSSGGNIYKDKQVLVLVDKEGVYSKQGFVPVDLSIFSSVEKKFLDTGYFDIKGNMTSKTLTGLDYFFVMKPLESEG